MDKGIAFRIIRVFVSSTFKDMDFERDYLKNVLLPKLNKEMADYNILVELCDLRTGIAKQFTSEEEQENYILETCFSYIQKTHPYFIALIGDRYGWVPPKHSIENLSQLFQGFGIDTSMVTDKSVTEVEIILGCLNKNKSNQGIICLRSDKSYDNMPDDVRETYVEKDENARASLSALKANIKELYKASGKEDSLIDYELEWKHNKFINLDKWGDKVYDTLKSKIIADIPAYIDLRSKVNRIMSNFIASNIYKSIDNNTTWNEHATHGIIREYNKLIFTGIEGVGSSTFMCQHYLRILNDNTNVFPIFYSLDAPGADCSFNKIIEYLTQEVNNYVFQLYQRHVVFNPEAPLQSLKEAIDLVAEKEYHILFIIDSYDKIFRHSNVYHHSLRWVPENAAIIISTAIEWMSEFSEHVQVFPMLPFLDKVVATAYVKSMGYKDLTDDIIDAILNPLFGNEDDDKLAYYKTPLWIRMVIDLLVDMNHSDYEIVRSSKKDYSTALKEYRKNIIPHEPIFLEELFLKLVEKNYSITEAEGFLLLLLLAISKDGLTEDTLNSYMNIDGVTFSKILSTTFNKYSKYISYSPESGKWNFKYQICKRSLALGYKKVLDFKSKYQRLLQILAPTSLNNNRVQDDLFYYIIRSNDVEIAESLINTFNAEIIRAGSREVAEELLEKTNREECFNWCVNFLTNGEGVTKKKVDFITKIFENLDASAHVKVVIDQIREITRVILEVFMPNDFDEVCSLMDFCNLLTDIYISEDLHDDAILTNSIAVQFTQIGEDPDTPNFNSMIYTALHQQQALILKANSYVPNCEEQDDSDDESIEQLVMELETCNEEFDQDPSFQNKMNLIKAYSKLAVSLYDVDYESAFLCHKNALILICEVNKSSDTNALRSCSFYLFSWAEECRKHDNIEMAKSAFKMVMQTDERLLEGHETKENLVNAITTLNRLTSCCTKEETEDIRIYTRNALYLIDKLVSKDFNICCNLWLKQAKICFDKQVYYEAFYVYDTMADELLKLDDLSYVLLLIEVLIYIAEIAFIDGGKDAGIHRIQYPIQQIDEARKLFQHEEHINELDELMTKCQKLLAQYAE